MNSIRASSSTLRVLPWVQSIHMLPFLIHIWAWSRLSAYAEEVILQQKAGEFPVHRQADGAF